MTELVWEHRLKKGPDWVLQVVLSAEVAIKEKAEAKKSNHVCKGQGRRVFSFRKGSFVYRG